jgi:CubicO group peptidase (beta-lactamase class C family)
MPRSWIARGLRPALLGAMACVLSLAAAPTAQGAAGAAAALPSCGAPSVEEPSGGPALLQKPAVTAAVQGIVGSLQTLRTQNGIASISVAAVDGQNMVFSASVGCADVNLQTPATPSTLYMLGSVTKTFTATMLMQLRDAGYLSLDDPMNAYVPQVQYASPEGATVSPTFRQLASHASGLQRTLNPEPPTVDALFNRLQNLTAVSDPGTAYLYSNLGFAVLGNALAQMVGMPYEQYVSTYILQPLGMNDSMFVPDAAHAAQVATGYTALRSTAEGVRATTVAAAQRGVFDPGGGLLSTADDMARYLELFFNDDSPLLAAPSRQEMFQPVIAADQTDSGAAANGEYATIGWFNLTTNPVPYISKDGSWAGFTAFVALYPQSKVGVVVLENVDSAIASGPAATGRVASMIGNTLVPALAQAGRGN